MAGESVYIYSKTAADNTVVGGISIAEGCSPAGMNNADRADLANQAKLRDDQGGALTSYGTNTITVTTNSLFTLADGVRVHFVAGGTNTGAATFNPNAGGAGPLGAKAIRRVQTSGEEALLPGDIIANGHYIVEYDASANGGAGAWILLNPTVGLRWQTFMIPYVSQAEPVPTAPGTVGVMIMPYAFRMTELSASLSANLIGGSQLILDIKENGTTILSTLLSFDNGEETTLTAATPAVISDPVIAAGAEITVTKPGFLDVGDSATGLITYITGYRTA